MSYSWENCPPEFKSLLDDIVEKHQEILEENLTGFYLHGSLAMGCFNPVLSDLDFLVTVREAIPIQKKKTLLVYLSSLDGRTPPKGIEMSIVLEKYLHDFVYPTPFELHYSDDWYKRYINGQIDLEEPRTDEDLAAHFMVVRERGICLFGKPVKEAFTDEPKIREAFARSLLFDAGQIFEAYRKDPLYAVLNLCRNLAYLKESKVLSKAEGTDWALRNLPKDFSPLVTWAKNLYMGEDEGEPDAGLLDRFVGFMKKEIEKYSEN